MLGLGNSERSVWLPVEESMAQEGPRTEFFILNQFPLRPIPLCADSNNRSFYLPSQSALQVLINSLKSW